MTDRRRWPRRLFHALWVYGVRVTLCLLILVQVLYLLRRPLFERWLCQGIAAILAEELDGDVVIGGIGGNWITSVQVTGITITSAGIVRQVRDAEVLARVDPWRLAMGDPGGLLQAEARIQSAVIDLTAPGSSTEASVDPTVDSEPVDLGPLTALLPRGALVELADLTVIGVDARIAGQTRVRLEPGPAHEARRLAVHKDGLQATAALLPNGHIDARFLLEDVAMVPRLFTPLSLLSGGTALASANLALRPVFTCRARIVVTGLEVDGRTVETLRATAMVEATHIHQLDASIIAPGGQVHLSGVGFTYEDLLAGMTGSVRVAVADLSPYGPMLPDVVSRMLPITGWIEAHAEQGVLSVDQGRLRTAAATLELEAGALPLDASAARVEVAPLRYTLRIHDGAALPLPGDLPLRPTQGVVRGSLRRIDGSFLFETRLALSILDGDGLTGRIRGPLTLAIGTGLVLQPDFTVEGDVLRSAGSNLRLKGLVEILDTTLRCTDLVASLPGPTDTLTANGNLTLAADDLASMLAGSDLRLQLQAMPLQPLGHLVTGIPDGGRVSGLIILTDNTLHADLQSETTSLAIAAGSSLSLRVDVLLDNDGVKVKTLDLQSGTGHLRASGHLLGPNLTALTQNRVEWSKAITDLTVDMHVPQLAAFDLASVSDLRLRGGLKAAGQVTGPITGLVPGGTLQLDQVEVSTTTQPDLLREVTARIQFAGERVQVDRLDGILMGHALQARGSLTLQDQNVTVDEFTIRDANGGLLRAHGSAPRPTDDGLLASLQTQTDFSLTLQDLNLDPWLALAGLPAEGGLANASVRLSPGAPDVTVQVRAHVASLRSQDLDFAPTFAMDLTANADGMRLETFALDFAELQVTGTGTLDITPEAVLLDPGSLLVAALDLRFQAERFSLVTLPAEQFGFAEMLGAADLSAHVRGSLSAPLITARVDLKDASLVTAGGERFDDLNARILVGLDSIEIARLEATRGKGPLSVIGTFKTIGPLWQHWQQGELDLTVEGRNTLLHRGAGVRVRADADLKVKGPLSDFLIAGTITLRDGRLVTRMPLLDLRSSGGRAVAEGLNIPGLDLGQGISGRLDVNVRTEDPFVVRNNILDGSLHVQMQVLGELAQPILTGRVTGGDTVLILPGVRLRAATLLLEFSASNPRFPVVTVNARGRRHGYDIQAVVRGRYDRPEILLSSDPPLPAEDLIVMVTTGSRPDALRGTQAVGTVLGAYLAQELADWIFGSESTEAKEGFLDRVTVETGAEISRGGTESVVVEFRLLDRIYLQGERDVYEDINMGVVFRVRFR